MNRTVADDPHPLAAETTCSWVGNVEEDDEGSSAVGAEVGAEESGDDEGDDEESGDDEGDDEEEGAAARPPMRPVHAKAKVFTCASTAASRTLAADVKASAMRTNRVHGTSTTGTPWLFARRFKSIARQNRTFLSWCRHWIQDCYGMEPRLVRAAATEPHIVIYDHDKVLQRKRKNRNKNNNNKGKAAFDGIGTHLDGSFVTCIMSLSEGDEYAGGGTYFPSLGTTVRLNVGEVLLFQGQQGPYSAPHRAQPIAGGKRVLYLAFFKLRAKNKIVAKKKRIKTKKKKKKKKKKKLKPPPKAK